MRKTHLEIDKKIYLSVKRVAEIAGYSNDYIGQLCRAEKLDCKMISRHWYVTEESVRRHMSESTKINHTSFKQEDFEDVNFRQRITRSIMRMVTPIANVRMCVPNAERMSVPLRRYAMYIFLSVIVLIGIYSVIPTSSSSIGSREMLVDSSSVSVASVISSGFDWVKSLLVGKAVVRSDVFGTDPIVSGNSSSTTKNNGMVVVPATNSIAYDNFVKQKIIDSFSDSVEIHPDASGINGVITPVFRQSRGSNYLYVMVPIGSPRSP